MELENAFAAQLVIHNHDYDVVRDFQLITLVGKCNVMDLYINIASLHGADAYWSIIVGFFHKSLKL